MHGARAARRALIGMMAALVSLPALATATPAARAAVTPVPQVTPIAADAGKGRAWGTTEAPEFRRYGYADHEFRLSGTATGYVAANRWTSDGRWSVTPKNRAAYTTRALVRAPKDPARFNGTVVVEWNNVSGQLDVSPDWAYSYQELLSQGYAWVGVTVQQIGAAALTAYDGDRYRGVKIPGDQYSYDIYTQAARALRDPRSRMLPGLEVRQLLATGHSQSGGRLVTYTNAVQPRDHAYDGLVVHGRGSLGGPLGDGVIDPSAPKDVDIRTDLDVPVIQMLSETDVTQGGPLPPYTHNQPDNPHLRTWQVAGTSHFDRNSMARLVPDISADLRVPEGTVPLQLGTCATPQNTAHFGWAQNAAYDGLRRWAAGGAPPPPAPPLARTGDGALKRDRDGNAIGGVRLPELMAPVAAYSGTNTAKTPGDLESTVMCTIFGSTKAFTRDRLRQLYPSHQAYVDAVTRAADRQVAAGFLLPPDRDAAVRDARARQVP